jgi:hypothetical protein
MSDVTTQPPGKRSPPARIAAFVASGLIALLALGLLAGGGAVLWADGQKDEQGYLSTGSDRFATSTNALATENLDVDSQGPGWLVNADRYGKVRLKVDSRTDKPLFVGIAPTSEVSHYLRHSPHAVVTDVSYSPFEADYRSHGGERRPAPPAEQAFWAASTHGSGEQTLTWDVRHGSWSIVVMNADGSAGVDAGVSAGADVPVLPAIGWSLLGAGLVLLVSAAGLVYLGVRRPHGRPRTPAAVPVAA